MHDALRVRGFQRVANLHRVLQRFIERQGPLRGAPSMYSITR